MSKKDNTDDSDDIEFVDSESENMDKVKNTKNVKVKGIVKSQGYPVSRKQLSSSSTASRRKTIHKVISTNDEILFESYPKLTDLTRTSTEQQTKTMPKLVPCSSNLENDSEQKKKTISNKTMLNSKDESIHPGLENMHRIAFLKACINYMLAAVGKETIVFDETGVTLSKLVHKYNTISPTEDEIIQLN